MKPTPTAQDYSTLVSMTYDSDGYPQSQIAPVGDGGTSTPAEARHSYGSIGRPADADQDATTGDVTNGAFAKTEKEGSTLHSNALDDPRVTAMLPPVPKGGHQTYGAQPNVPTTVSTAQHDGQGNYAITIPVGKSLTFNVQTASGTIKVAIGPGGITVTGLTPTTPMVVGEGPPTPATAALIGATYLTSKPSTILFVNL